MQYKQIILSKLIEYLKYKEVKLSRGHLKTFLCPFCNKTATILPNTHYVNCFVCKPKQRFGDYFTVIEMARKLEPKMSNASDEEVLQYLKEVLNVKVMTKQDEHRTVDVLNKYKEWGFDLVPIVANGKIPAEKEWTQKNHVEVDEWMRWIKDGLNIGVKTGKISNVTIVDIDIKPIPKEIEKLLEEGTFTQETTNGFHLVYQYEPELPKTRIDELKIDIENDGGQVVLYPSRIKDKPRIITKYVKPTKMPKKLKEYLQKKLTVPRKTKSEKISEDIVTEDFNLALLGEGQRNSSLVRIGGILRKELNQKQTEYVVHMLNKILCKNPLNIREVRAMVNSLERYTKFDEQELAHKVLDYLKSVEEANRTEVAMAVVNTNRGEEKKRVDKALQYLVKEGHVLKLGRSYAVVQKADWKECLIEIGKPIDFKMPYFSDVACFNYGDMILIGSKNKKGKSHIALNIVKKLVEQGIKPYYITSEPGNRFSKIALQLGLKEGDMKWDWMIDPTKIELEKDGITIIDWLCPKDFAKTDKLFMHFMEQLYKTDGVLIVFMQLKENNDWFAVNMVKQFPSLATKYIYDVEGDGEYGKFVIEVIREPKIRIKSYEIPCKYDWETKKLTMVGEEETGEVV